MVSADCNHVVFTDNSGDDLDRDRGDRLLPNTHCDRRYGALYLGGYQRRTPRWLAPRLRRHFRHSYRRGNEHIYSHCHGFIQPRLDDYTDSRHPSQLGLDLAPVFAANITKHPYLCDRFYMFFTQFLPIISLFYR